ncbi:MAG: SDR family NAD(P)-dependent oxidoreductase [Planctomycetia bacterium]
MAWHDRRAIVAGGTAGFGLVLARHLALAGARVIVVGRSSAGVRAALEACERAGAPSTSVHGLAADLARAGEGDRVAAEAGRILGGIDDVFFCVGRSGRAAILQASRATLQEYLDANLLAAVELTQAVADDVAKARGHLVYIGSLAGKIVMPFMGPYSVAKSALAAYVDAVGSNWHRAARMSCSCRPARSAARPTTLPPIEPRPATPPKLPQQACRRKQPFLAVRRA